MSSFCKNCGSLLDENGVCNNCGSVYSNSTAYEQPQNDDQIYQNESGEFVDVNGNPIPSEFLPDMSSTYESSYEPESVEQEKYADADEYQPRHTHSYEQTAPKQQFDIMGLLNGCLNTAVDFFTAEPSKMIETGMKETGWSWTIFAGLFAFVGALCNSAVAGNIAKAFFNALFEIFPYASYLYQNYTFGNMFLLFLVSFLLFAVMFFALTGCHYLVLTAFKKKTDFIETAKAVALSYFPMAVACAGAYIISFILLPVAILMLLAGYMVSMYLLKASVKQQISEELPFWYAILNCIIQVSVIAIFVFIAVKIVL